MGVLRDRVNTRQVALLERLGIDPATVAEGSLTLDGYWALPHPMPSPDGPIFLVQVPWPDRETAVEAMMAAQGDSAERYFDGHVSGLTPVPAALHATSTSELIEFLEREAGAYALQERGQLPADTTLSWDGRHIKAWEAAQELRRLSAAAEPVFVRSVDEAYRYPNETIFLSANHGALTKDNGWVHGNQFFTGEPRSWALTVFNHELTTTGLRVLYTPDQNGSAQ